MKFSNQFNNVALKKFDAVHLDVLTAARDHFDGTVEAGECRFCAFDARNREHHARNAGRLF